uniref:Phosphatidylinositol diacylglycerol-lyase n=1 Tax=uncultured bacterium fosmid pJB83B9 TaxID=1478070 RepID=A0A0H3U849_9BACT|nr:hypothetical protein [uncultured bacterium fosmid pJB83B9]
MIASHNSWSYLSPRRIWMYLVAPFSRCQSKSIDGQLALGVRMFDMRIKILGSKVYLAHGLMEFEITPMLADLVKIRDIEGCSIRILLENRNPDDDSVKIFQKTVASLKAQYPTIQWFGGHGAHGSDWCRHYVCLLPSPSYAEDHASVSARGLWRILPRIYAICSNKKIKGTSHDLPVMIDFVEL